MDLKNMLLPEKVVTFDFPGCEGLSFDLCFLSKESNQSLYKKCQKIKFDKNRQEVTEFDDELFLKLYVAAVIKGWKGLTFNYLQEFVLVDVSPDTEDKLLNFNDDNALELMKASTVLDGWISEVITDLGNFTSKGSTPKLSESKTTSKNPDQD